MTFLEDLRANVIDEPNFDEERYFQLSRDLKMLKTMPEKDSRKLILETMNYTGTWLSTSDLSIILNDEDYGRISKCTMDDIKARYAAALENNPGREDEIKQAIEQDFRETFFAVKKGNEEYKLKEAPYGIAEYSVNYNEIDSQALRDVVASAMQKHLEADAFHDQQGRKAEWIKNILSQTIKELSKEQPKQEISQEQ